MARVGGQWCLQQRSAALQRLGTVPVGEEAVVVGPHEAFRQDGLEEAVDQLLCRQVQEPAKATVAPSFQLSATVSPST
jgi:hypothetical protein